MSRKKSYPANENETPDKSGFKFKPKTIGQSNYVKKIYQNTVTFCTGPAGTGKSACAIAIACRDFLDGKYEEIIIARPAIEASKRGLGFLPGDLNEKLKPYMMPAIYNLKKFLGTTVYNSAIEQDRIKFEPLEYMRGRTFDHAFMILEEAQNCTVEQLTMFVSRIGEDSKIVINGDVEQTDLEYNKFTDLEIVIDRVLSSALTGFSAIKLTDEDIVRNPIIVDFLKAMRNI